MKRKVSRSGGLRLSPNEEALLLREEHERRRRLRLQQVREQERNIALQIRQDVKQRRDEQLQQLAEELKKEWRKEQDEKIKALEELYRSSLSAIGESHRLAKEKELDLEALAEQAAERKQIAEKRHKEALKEKRSQREKLQREQTWRVNARKHALEKEKKRAAKIASLPPPPPHPCETIELKNLPTNVPMKVGEGDHFSQTHHHLFDPYVDKEIDIEQPDAWLLAEEEVKLKEKLQNEEDRDRREQLEKAHLRGKHALKMVRLARDKEKLMQELEKMHNRDLARRRRIVAQMPPQLFVPSYRRMEIKEEWQRELECAFEDMYTGDRKMKGDLILHLDPQPLPALSDHSQDNELELSQEPDSVSEVSPKLEDGAKDQKPGDSEEEKTLPSNLKLPLTKLLNKIRDQKNQWMSRCEEETRTEMGTIESGTLSGRERKLHESESEHESKTDSVSEIRDLPQVLDHAVVAGNVVISHPQEQATEIGIQAERQTQLDWLEQQKQEQLALLQQMDRQKIRLEADLLKAQMLQQEEEAKKDPELEKQLELALLKQMEKQKVRLEADLLKAQLQQKEEEAKLHLELQKQQELALLKQMEKQKVRLAVDLLKAQLQQKEEESKEELEKRAQQSETPHMDSTSSAVEKEVEQQSETVMEAEVTTSSDDHIQKIRDYQQRLLMQNRKHKESVDEARRLLLEYQERLKQRYPSASVGLLSQVQKPAQKYKEQMVDVRSGRKVLPVWVEGSSSQLSQPCSSQTEKLSGDEPPVTQSLESEAISGSFILKSKDTSATSLPVACAQQIRFNLPTSESAESAETLFPGKSDSYPSAESYPSAGSHPSLERLLQPTFLLKERLSTESQRTITDPSGLFPIQPLSSMSSSVEREIGGIQECVVETSESFSSSEIMELRGRMVASSERIQAQQEYLKELQEQLDEQRKTLLHRQRVQEEVLLQKHTQLKERMEQQQQALKNILSRAKQSTTYGEMTEAQESDSFDLILTKEANGSSEEEVETEPLQNLWRKEKKWRISKPPLTKIKLELDLEQHELSVIPELDTPRSTRLSSSAPGYKESFAGEPLLTLDVGELESSKHLTDSLPEELDMMEIAPDANEKSSSESLLSQLSELWCEKLILDASGFGEEEEVHHGDPTSTDRDLPRSSEDLRGAVAMDIDPSFRPNSMVALSAPWSRPASPPAVNQESAGSNLSLFTLSSASFISSDDKPARSFASSGMCSSKYLSENIGLLTEEKESCIWDYSISQLPKQGGPSETPGAFPSSQELLSDRSKFQELMDKYLSDLSWSSLSNISSHGAEDFFQPVPVESIEHTQSAAGPANVCTVSERLLETRESVEVETNIPSENIEQRVLERDETCIGTFSPIEHFRSPSLSPIEDQGSFYQLLPDYDTKKNVIEIKCLEESMASGRDPCFVELPVVPSARKCEIVTENVTVSDDPELDLSQCTLHTVEQNFLGADIACLSPEVNLTAHMCAGKNSGQQNDFSSDALQQPYLNGAHSKNLSPRVSQSSISIWETHTGNGIMEEPELTLINSKDISTVESDLEFFSQEDNEKKQTEQLPSRDHSEIKCSPKSEEFLPLHLEVDDASSTESDSFAPVGQSPKEYSLTQKHKPTEFTVIPETLQESFLKRKKNFIKTSSQRLEKLKSRERGIEQSHIKAAQQKKKQLCKRKENMPPPGLQVDMKKVEEVKVNSADDRKTAELQMYQRTSRLYNNLSEVKVRKKEKERQETNARNRERAKEFQKKTLEKLRNKKTP